MLVPACRAAAHASMVLAATLLTAVALLAAAPLAAQPERSRVPTAALVEDARHKASVGDTSGALALLERATDQSPRDPDALYWRGVVLSRTTSLTIADTPRRLLAWHLLSRAADIDARNPRYLIELGRVRLNTPIMRVEAERLFRRALSVAESSGDPAQLAEVAYELGLIKARRYLSGKNRWLYTTTLLFDPIVAQRRLHYTREFLDQLSRPIKNAASVDRSEAEEYYRRALAAVPAHEPSALGLLALLYDQRRFDEMLVVAAPVRESPEATARIFFATGLSLYRLGRVDESEHAFSRAVARLPSEQRADVLDLAQVLRRSESARVAALSVAERARTDSAFWEAADPMLSTPVNEARHEYLARVAFGDLFYTDAETRQVGWRTDRGRVVARYGEPPVIATFPPSSDSDAGDAIGRVLTVWFYPRTEVEFVFFGPPAINSASFAGNYRDFLEERRDAAPFMLDNLPMALAVDSLSTQLARFRGPTSAETELVVATSIDASRLYRAVDIDRGQLEVSVRVGPAARLRLASADTLPVALPAVAQLPYTWVDTVRNGEYRVRLEARDPSVTGALARAQLGFESERVDETRLGSSDLLLAKRVAAPTGTLRSWHSLGLVPLADLRIAPRDTFAVYWENYGLRPDAAQRVAYEVRLVVTLLQLDRGRDPVRNLFGNIADVVGLSPEGDAQLGMRFERNQALDGRDRVPELVNLGLGTAPSGRYRLEVMVTDRVGGQSTRSQREFTISRDAR